MRRTRRAPSGGAWVAVLGLFASACGDGPTGVAPPGTLDLARPWTTAAPADVDMDPDVLAGAANAAAAVDRFRSLVVVRRGKIVLERYFGGTDLDTPADVRSVTKSVVSILTGIALDRGELAGLDQPIGGFLRAPEYDLRPEHAAITVRHLLTMTGGFEWSEVGNDVSTYNDWVLSPDPVEFLLSRPVSHTPGGEFAYNAAAVHLLGVVLEEATGQSLPQYADRVLFGPLGIASRTWEPLGDGHVNGGSGLDLRPRDLARLGQLMLQRGWSGGVSVVSAPWVSASTTRRFGWTIAEGAMARVSYAFLWWLDLDRDAFFAEGYRGQFIYVMPGADLVVVATTDLTGGAGAPSASELRNLVASVLVEHVVAAVR